VLKRDYKIFKRHHGTALRRQWLAIARRAATGTSPRLSSMIDSLRERMNRFRSREEKAN
jgi:hypothetical protein